MSDLFVLFPIRNLCDDQISKNIRYFLLFFDYSLIAVQTQ